MLKTMWKISAKSLTSKISLTHLKTFFVFVVFLCIVWVLKHSIYRIDLGVDRSTRHKTVEQLVEIASKLAKLDRLAATAEEREAIHGSYIEVQNLLQGILASNDICNGTLKARDKCPRSQPLSSLITFVFNFAQPTQEDNSINTVLHDVSRHYPGVKVIAGASITYKQDSGVPKSTNVIRIKKSWMSYLFSRATQGESDIWNILISQVTTPFVYVARDVIRLTNATQLTSLLDNLRYNEATVAASSWRTLNSGKWTHGCQQSSLANYTLVYRDGYDMSLTECLLCKYVSGPFLTKTPYIKKEKLVAGMSATSAFSHWFLKLAKRKRIVVTCPGSMGYVDDDSVNLQSKREQWLPLVKDMKIESLYLSDDTHFTFGCDEAQTQCRTNRESGLAISHCCLNELSQATLAVLRECHKSGLACEISDGTILGAAKMEGIMPWEVDSDISIERGNFTAFKEIVGPAVEKNYPQYRFADEDTYYRFYTKMGWFVEIFPIGPPDTRKMQDEGLVPTRILVDGEYVQAPESPGLMARNRYGKECYQHANHWRKNGETSGFHFYTSQGQFAECPVPGDHACLDQYVADGNRHFRKPFV